MPENTRGLTIDQTLARRAAERYPNQRWFDREGNQITQDQSQAIEKAMGARNPESLNPEIARTIVGEAHVITSFLGHDYTNEVDRPYVYEQVVVTRDDEGRLAEKQLIDHFPNPKEALEAHKFTAEALRQGHHPLDIVPRDKRVLMGLEPATHPTRGKNPNESVERRIDAYESQLTPTDRRTLEASRAIGDAPRQQPQPVADRDIFPKEMVTSEVRYGKNGTPYIPEVIGVYHQPEPRIEERVVLDKRTGEERRQSYGVAAGNYNIIGAWSADRERILDTVVAYRGVDLATGEKSILSTQTKPSIILDLAEAQTVTLEPGISQALHEGSFHRRSEVAQKQQQDQEQALSLHVA